MLHLSAMRRFLAGSVAVATVPQRHTHRVNPYVTMRPRVQAPQSPTHATDTDSNASAAAVARVKEFKRFYATVTRSREATSLPPTPLGHAGSERILNNELLHESPWQASCVELRERPVEEEKKVLSYDNIDFATLRGRFKAAAGASSAARASGSYTNVEDMRPAHAPQAGPGLDVVHYYETSSSAGLAGYQQVAMQVRKGILPGSCTNYSAEGGFAVWVVPLADYTRAMAAMGLLPN